MYRVGIFARIWRQKQTVQIFFTIFTVTIFRFTANIEGRLIIITLQILLAYILNEKSLVELQNFVFSLRFQLTKFSDI